MKIAVYGFDDLGQALGIRFAENGHTVIFTAKDIESEAFAQFMEKAACVGAVSAPLQEAINSCQYLVLAVPGDAAMDTCSQCNNLGDRIVIDCTGPIGNDAPLTDTAPATHLQEKSNGGRFVKAFNITGPPILKDSRFEGATRPLMLLCGDDETAMEKVAILCDDLGFEPVMVGDMQWAAHLDTMGSLWQQLSRQESLDEHFTWSLLKRDRP